MTLSRVRPGSSSGTQRHVVEFITASSTQRESRAGQRRRLALGFGLALMGIFASPVTTALAQPPNDNFADATVLNPSGGDSELDFNTDATKEPSEPNHAGNAGGASVWYSWTPTTDLLATIDTCVGTSDTIMGVYTGASVSSLTEVSSNNDGCPDLGPPPPPGSRAKGGVIEQGGSLVHFVAEAGTTYRIAVDGYDGAEVEIRLVLSSHEASEEAPPPPTYNRTVRRRVGADDETRRIRVIPRCEPGTYRGELRLPKLKGNGDQVGLRRVKDFRCDDGRAQFLDEPSSFRLRRTWWRQAHTERGLTLVALIDRAGATPPTAEPLWFHGRSDSDRATAAAPPSYSGTGLSCVGTAFSGGSELLSVGAEFTWGVANFNEWVQVVGYALPYFPGSGYGQWTRSSNTLQYQVRLSGSTSSGISISPNLFVVGGTTAPGSAWYIQWNGSNSYSVPNRTWVLMGIYIWTQRTGWFFAYVTPENITGDASRSGDWCYFN